jgi:hypothetical protein
MPANPWVAAASRACASSCVATPDPQILPLDEQVREVYGRRVGGRSKQVGLRRDEHHLTEQRLAVVCQLPPETGVGYRLLQPVGLFARQRRLPVGRRKRPIPSEGIGDETSDRVDVPMLDRAKCRSIGHSGKLACRQAKPSCSRPANELALPLRRRYARNATIDAN